MNTRTKGPSANMHYIRWTSTQQALLLQLSERQRLDLLYHTPTPSSCIRVMYAVKNLHAMNLSTLSHHTPQPHNLLLEPRIVSSQPHYLILRLL